MSRFKYALRLISRGRIDLVIRYTIHFIAKRVSFRHYNFNQLSRILKPRGSSPEQEYLISVIVTNHNLTDYLERCLKSVLNQTLRIFEIIIVESSSDLTHRQKSFELISSLKVQYPSIHIDVVDKKPAGVVENRNVGASRSRGNLFFFLDPDDYLDPN